MKAEELRTGSIVQYKWFEKPSFRKTIIHREQVSVLAIDGENKRVLIKPKQHRKNHTWVSLERIKPIPLSEEVLLKCGATLDGIEYIIKASALPVKIRLHSGIAYCEFGNVYLGDRIKYLHELQSLVFALCGRELEVSL